MRWRSVTAVAGDFILAELDGEGHYFVVVKPCLQEVRTIWLRHLSPQWSPGLIRLIWLARRVSPSSLTAPCASLPKLRARSKRTTIPDSGGPVFGQGYTSSCAPLLEPPNKLSSHVYKHKIRKVILSVNESKHSSVSYTIFYPLLGLTGWLSICRCYIYATCSICHCRRHGFDLPGSGRSLEEGSVNPTSVFLTRKSHGHRSLAGCSQQNCKRVGHDLATKQKSTSYGNLSQKYLYLSQTICHKNKVQSHRLKC